MNAAFARRLPPRRPSSLPSPASGRRARQRGISLFVVMIVLMLALILMLSGLSASNLNESIVGNQSDAQRAYSSAQALLDAAQRDIRLNGLGCNAAALGGQGKHLDFPAPGITTDCTLRFPRNVDDYGEMVSGTPGLGNCGDKDTAYTGVCISRGPADPKFATKTTNNSDEDVNAQQWDKGATYTQFVAELDKADANGIAYGGDAEVGGTAMATPMNNGKYWVEVFKYHIGCGNDGCPDTIPDGAYPFVFRITAIAQGLKGESTASVLRTYYTPYPMQP